jgi:hypothetical protein
MVTLQRVCGVERSSNHMRSARRRWSRRIDSSTESRRGEQAEKIRRGRKKNAPAPRVTAVDLVSWDGGVRIRWEIEEKDGR